MLDQDPKTKKLGLTPLTAKEFILEPVSADIFKSETSPEKKTGFWSGLNKKFAAGTYGLAEAITETPQFGEGIKQAGVKMLADAVINRKVRKGELTKEQGEIEKARTKDYLPQFDFMGLPHQAGKELPGTKMAEGKANQWLESTARSIRESNNRYDKAITDYIKNHEYGKAIGASTYSIAESLPSTLAAMLGGPGGAAALGVTTGAQTYDEVKDRDDMTEAMKVIDGVSTGTFEWLFEWFGSAQAWKLLQEGVAKSGTKAVEESVKKGITGVLGNAYKRFGVWFAPVHEGVSELATTIGQNATAKLTGDDPNRKITDGALDSFIVGMGMGAGMTGSAKGLEYLGQKYGKKINSGETPLDQSGLNTSTGPLTVPAGVNTEQPALSIDEQVEQNFAPLAQSMEQFRSRDDGDLHMYEDQQGKVFYKLQETGDNATALFISAETEEGQPVEKAIKGLAVMKPVGDQLYADWMSNMKVQLRAGLEATNQAAAVQQAEAQKTPEDSYSEEIKALGSNPEAKPEDIQAIRDRVTNDMVNGVKFSDQFLNVLGIEKPEVVPPVQTPVQSEQTTEQPKAEPKSFPIAFTDKKLLANKAIEQANGTYLLETPFQDIEAAEKAQKEIQKRFGHKGYTATIESTSTDESNPFADEIHQVRINIKPIQPKEEVKPVEQKKEEPVAKSKEQPAAESAKPVIDLTPAKAKQRERFKSDSRTGKVLKFAPRNFDESLMQYILAGGSLSRQDYMDNTGGQPGSKEVRSLTFTGIITNNGRKFDAIPEALGDESFMGEGVDIINKIVDVLNTWPSKGKILTELERRFDEPTQQEPTEEEMANDYSPDVPIEETSPVLLDEFTAEIMQSKELMSIFDDTDYLNAEGYPDWDFISYTIKNDIGAFTQFPYGLNDNEIGLLINLSNDTEKQRLLQEQLEVRNSTQGEVKTDITEGSPLGDTQRAEVESSQEPGTEPTITPEEQPGAQPEPAEEVEQFKLGNLTFANKQEFTDWLDKNYNEQDRFDSVNSDGYLESNTMKVFSEWYKENKERLAKEDFEKISKKESKPESNTPTSGVFNKQQVIETLVREIPEEDKQMMRETLSGVERDEFNKIASQAGYNNVGPYWTLGSVVPEKKEAETPTFAGDIFKPENIKAVDKKIKLKKEEKKVNTEPTEAQKEAGNYKMGHISINGMDISIENAKGSIREGTDQNGKKWLTKMNNAYGYFRGTVGRDKDHVDVFIGDNLNPENVFIVDQLNPETGKFDELKIMLGFDTETQAEFAYYLNYQEGWKGLGAISTMPVEEFKAWLYDGKAKTGPVAWKEEQTQKPEEIKVEPKEEPAQEVPEDDNVLFEEQTPYQSLPGTSNLVALHNISEGNIINAEQIGGLVTPSIAIVKKGEKYTDFGSITLIADKDMIDPEKSSVKVFKGDVYSPAVPRARYEVNKREYSKWAAGIMNKAYSKYREIASTIANAVEDFSPLYKDLQDTKASDVISDNRIQNDLKLIYLVENNVPIDIPTVGEKIKLGFNLYIDELTEEEKARAKDVKERFNKETEASSLDLTDKTKEDVYNLAYDITYRHYKETYSNLGEKESGEYALDHAKNAREKVNYHYFIDSLGAYLNGKRNVDSSKLPEATNKAFESFDKKGDFESWATGKLQSFQGRKYFEKGNAKIPYNLNNLVDATTGHTRAKEKGMTFGMNRAKATAVKQMKNLDQIRKASKDLVSKEEITRIDKEMQDEYFKIADKIKYKYGDQWGKLDDFGRSLADYFKGRSPQSALMGNGFQPSEWDVENFKEFADKLKNSPIDYLEAKTQRAVGINEFKYAVVPEGTSSKVLEILTKKGLNVRTYNTAEERTQIVSDIANEDSNIAFEPITEYVRQNNYHTVRLTEIPTSELFEQFKTLATRLGGHWNGNRTNGMVAGFVFRSQENAERFQAYLDNDMVGEPETVYEDLFGNKIPDQITLQTLKKYPTLAKPYEDIYGKPISEITDEEVRDFPDGYSSVEERRKAINKAAEEAIQQELHFGWGVPAIQESGRSNLPPEKIRPRTVIEGFKESGYVNFTGQRITGPQDIADLWSIHRSPYIEKSHVVFVKDGVIIGSTAGTANRSDTTSFMSMGNIRDLYHNFGADGVYFLHNHPSGVADPSVQDVYMTLKNAEKLKAEGVIVKGHVVIDTDKFTFINTEKNLPDVVTADAVNDYYKFKEYETHEYKNAVPKLFSDRESISDPENEGGAQKRMFEIAKALLTGKGYKGAVIYLSAKLDISAYDVFPEGASVTNILKLLKQGLVSNLGAKAILIHDGSYEDKFSAAILPYEVLDVMDTGRSISEYFRTGERGSTDYQSLWDNQSEYRPKAITDLETRIEETKKKIVETSKQRDAKKKELSARVNVQQDLFAGDILRRGAEQKTMFEIRQDASLDNIQKILTPFDNTLARLKDELKGLEARLKTAERELSGEQTLFEGMEPYSPVNSEKFKKWFGDSRVVDENGMLLPTKELALIGYEKGATNTEIAEALGLSQSAISKALRMQGVESRATKYKYSSEQKDQAVQMYKDGKNTVEIAEILNASSSTISRWVNEEGIIRSNRESQGVSEELVDRAVNMYKQGTGSHIIAHELGVAKSSVLNWVGNANIIRRGIESRGISTETPSNAVRLYMEGMSAKAVGNLLGVSDGFVLRSVQNSGNKTRTYSEVNAITASKSIRKTRGISAIHTLKTGEQIKVDSIYELARVYQLENDNSVKYIKKEKDIIPYGDGHYYNPDIFIEYENGSKFVEEIKPEYLLLNSIVQKKANAAEQYYSKRGIGYRIITENIIGEQGFSNVELIESEFKSIDDFKKAKHALLVAKSNIRNFKITGDNGNFNPDDPNILHDEGSTYQRIQTLKDKISTVSDDKVLRDKYKAELKELELNEPAVPYVPGAPPAKSSNPGDPSSKMIKNRWDYLYELIAQKMLSVQRLQEAILGRGGKVTDETNVMIAENRAASKARTQIENYHRDIFSPLLSKVGDILNKTRETYADDVVAKFDQYLRAKHSPERNAFMQEKNGREQNADFTTEEAEKIIAEYEALLDQSDIDELWKSMNQATEFTLKKYVETGFMTQKQYKEIKAMGYDHYVPLRGWKESFDDIFNYQESSSTGGAYQPLKKAKGRTSESAFVLAYVQSMANTAIVSGEKNLVKQAASQLILDNKKMDDLFRFLTVYTVDTGNVDVNGDPITYDTVEKPDQDIWDDGKVTISRNRDHEVRRPKWLSKQHEVQVFLNGQRVILAFTDPNIANAINNTNSWQPEMTRYLQGSVGKFTRWLSANFTAKNPAFMPINQLRDLGYAVVSHSLKYGTATDFVGNLKKARRSIIRYTKGKADMNDPIDKLHEEWRLGGGPTGYIHLDDVKDIEKSVIKELSRTMGTNSKWDKATQIALIQKGGRLLDNLAKRSEDLSRFATYLTLLENGYSHIEAINGSKEITVNFNTKGRIAGSIGSLFAFFNASTQGGINIGKLAIKHRKKFMYVSAGFMAMGFINALLASLWSDEDENGDSTYFAMGDWVRQNNLMIPTSRGFVTIPMPFGFRSFYAWGVLAHDMAYGQKKPGEAVVAGMSSVIESLSPVNPAGFFSSETGISIRPVVPTVAVPWYDLVVNENFAGKKLYQKPFTTELEEKIASSQQALKYVSPYIKGVTDKLYELGGGNTETKLKYYVDSEGQIKKVPSMMDINPSKVEHIFDNYLGGRFQFWNQVATTATEIVKGAAEMTQTGELKSIVDDVPLNTVPVLRRLYQEPWEKPYWKKYYEYREEIELYNSVKSSYSKIIDPEKWKVLEQQAEMQQKSAIFKEYNDLIKETYQMAGSKEIKPEMKQQLLSERERYVLELIDKLDAIDTKNK